MSKINKIKLSGTTYELQDLSATSVVSLTQAEYDILPSSAKTANILYNITDAQGVDLSQYWTSAQTQSAITQATSGKADTSYVDQSVSGKVDNSVYTAYTATTDTAIQGKQNQLTAGTGISIINDVISVTGGGSITIDQTVISGSTNAVAGGAVYQQVGGFKLRQVTQAEYNALVTGGTVDNSTIYYIVN